jgi:gluconolactonase
MKHIPSFLTVLITVLNCSLTAIAVPTTSSEAQLISPSKDHFFLSKTEGASVDRLGNFYAVDYGSVTSDASRKINTLGRLNITTGKSELFYTDPDADTYLNGARFAHRIDGKPGGRVLLADVNGHRVIELAWKTPDPPTTIQLGENGNAVRRVLCQDATMIQPNDLAISPDGKHVYLTGQKVDEEGNGVGDVWHCGPDGVASKLLEMGRTNGIEVSPDGKTLYVSEAIGGWAPSNNLIWKIPLNEDGLPARNKTLFVDFNELDDSGKHDIDGMRCDIDGFLYVTRNSAGKVARISPAGELVQSITVPFSGITNLELAGPEGKTLLMVGADPNSTTNTGRVAQFNVKSPGRAWSELQH